MKNRMIDDFNDGVMEILFTIASTLLLRLRL